MSLEIDWDKLLEDEDSLSEKVRKFLDDQFHALTLPSYIESVSVTSFSFGSIVPEVTIKHISDPFPEFYEDEDEDEDVNDEEARTETVNGSHGDLTADMSSDTLVDTSSLPSYHTDEEVPDPSRRQSFAPGTVEDSHMAELLGGAMGAAGSGYFHPALTASLLSSMRPIYTPLHSLSTLATPGIRTPVPEQAIDDGEHRPDAHSSTTGRENDIQFFLEVSYKGDMQLGVTATLLVNYPSPSFVSLPMKLTVTGLDVHALAVLAYVQKRIHFSFICDVDSGTDSMTLLRHEKIDIIRDIRIESEIGAHVDHGPVLRNVGKLEKFLLERIRSMARDELAWPGWLTFEF